MNILVTGGTGYIGSHTAIELLDAGHEPTLLDDFSNSSPGALAALRLLANRDIPFVQADVRDDERLDAVFASRRFDAVVHFAALKSVADSVAQPLAYYDVDVSGTASVLRSMARHGVKTIVFSSSATVYGAASAMPLTEDSPLAPVNPYGRCKRIAEQMLRDLHAADAEWRISILRYFNPVGAHRSGLVGEDPAGEAQNLLPVVAKVAAGLRGRLDVFGDDYPTPDGTCIRDYVHVVDLAKGHVKALDYLADGPRLAIHNLGTGHGHSVFEVIRAFEQASGRKVPHRVVERRPGDVAESYADVARARVELGWEATFDLQRMCEDVWRWHSSHPDGYADATSDG